MKDYIKPTFILAGLAPVALAVSNCRHKFKDNDLYMLYEGFGYSEELYGSTFAASETNCSSAPIPDDLVDYYCKFTSTAEATGGVALTS